MSSAGNTRGLIEAVYMVLQLLSIYRLPRGIPAASLKPFFIYLTLSRSSTSSAGNTRGLIEALRVRSSMPTQFKSSAGNTRGLIEASSPPTVTFYYPRLPRGIPAASLKPAVLIMPRGPAVRLPRGIPAASLKQAGFLGRSASPSASSAGNTRGLIEARVLRFALARRAESSAGNTRGLIEAPLPR